ncbi:MAG: hypothetical protein U9Q63_00355 [Patescibacteria group bacterium]|nr:hypothetical protein [Patescibacteria group bacterium]
MKLLIIFYLFLFGFIPKIHATDKPHPLRPFPKNPIEENLGAEFLTPYCAQRPTAVHLTQFDKRSKTTTLTVNGILNSNFTEFTTPLLSKTNDELTIETNSNEVLFPLLGKLYLADYFEGRAFYEPEPENTPSSIEDRQKLFIRYGVLRRLASSGYQDKLKRVLIKRGHGDYETFEELEEIYGFKPSSIKVNPNTPVQNFTLNHFYNHWAPLPKDEEFNTWEEYRIAYDNWADCDSEGKNCSQWFNLWDYVPMFTREDSVGQIIVYDEPNQTSEPQIVDQVFHPHLARTYEVSSFLSHALSPRENPTPKDPKLLSQWIIPAPWTNDPFWIESGQNMAPDSGTVCDPQNPVILSPGDVAFDSAINTTVDKTLTINTPKKQYDPNCVDNQDNDSKCYYEKKVRFSPASFQTLTPFVVEITDNLTTGKFALFNIFRSRAEIQANPPENWPGVGYEDEKNPNYSFDNGLAEAGNKNPGNTAKYYYKYLGWVHCQKENLLARFHKADTYIPFAPECLPFLDQTNLTPAANTSSCQELMDKLDLHKTVIPTDFDATIEKVANNECVDSLILKAILLIEGNFTPSSGGKSFACQPNYCSATGPMQITAGWECVNCDKSKGKICGNYCNPETNQVYEDKKNWFNAWFATAHEDENICDFEDSLAVAARLLKIKAGNLSCLTTLNIEGVRTAANNYYGSDKPIPRLNNISYGDFVVNYINNH